MNLSTHIAELTEVYKAIGDRPVMVRIDHETRPLASNSIAYNLANGHVSIAAYSHEGMEKYCPDVPGIDYRELLKKYVKLIAKLEGVIYLRQMAENGFTVEEIAAINAIDDEG